MSKIGFRSLCLLALTCFVLVGCRKDVKPEGLPKLYPCKITIVQAGQPLAGATVNLVSADGKNSKWPVGAVTDEMGVATIVTYGKYKGAPNGDWAVTVNKTIMEDDSGNIVEKPKRQPGDPPPNPFERNEVNVISLIPVEYGESDTTSLNLTTSGKTETQIDLGESVHIQMERRVVPY